jgi:hypothetical protein
LLAYLLHTGAALEEAVGESEAAHG